MMKRREKIKGKRIKVRSKGKKNNSNNVIKDIVLDLLYGFVLMKKLNDNRCVREIVCTQWHFKPFPFGNGERGKNEEKEVRKKVNEINCNAPLYVCVCLSADLCPGYSYELFFSIVNRNSIFFHIFPFLWKHAFFTGIKMLRFFQFFRHLIYVCVCACMMMRAARNHLAWSIFRIFVSACCRVAAHIMCFIFKFPELNANNKS